MHRNSSIWTVYYHVRMKWIFLCFHLIEWSTIWLTLYVFRLIISVNYSWQAHKCIQARIKFQSDWKNPKNKEKYHHCNRDHSMRWIIIVISFLFSFQLKRWKLLTFQWCTHVNACWCYYSWTILFLILTTAVTAVFITAIDCLFVFFS